MKKLSRERFVAAARFIREHARPVDRALYRYHFAGGTVDAVLEELARCQNADGGFGHKLEPDLRTPDSSAIATSHAMQITRELRVSPLPGTMDYLRATYDPAKTVWPIIPPTANNAPHAPWWTTANLAASWNHFRANPTAELAGYLDDPHWQQEVVAHALAYLESLPDKIEMHELLCFLRLAEMVNLPATAQAKLARLVQVTVVRDPAKWAGYGLRPLKVVRSPASPYYAELREAVNANLDYLIDEQAADASWLPTWHWGSNYPDVWPVARREWQGILTLDALKTLRAFGRL